MVLPVYDAILPDNDFEGGGISVVSLVDCPAIESNFVKLADEAKVLNALQFNQDKQIITGAILVPDKLIYRVVEGNEFFIRFSADTIKQLHYSMMNSGSFGRFSLHHNGLGLKNSKITPLEVWLKEYDDDKSNALGYDLPKGTLFMSAKIEDAELWERIKQNEFNGFSIEAILDYQYANMEKFLFNAVAIGEKVVHQSASGVNFAFSGEFVEGEQTVVVSEGVIEDIKDAEGKSIIVPEEEPKQDESNIKEIIEEAVEAKINGFIEKIDEKLSAIAANIAAAEQRINESVEKQDKELGETIGALAEIKLSIMQAKGAEVTPVQKAVKLSKIETYQTLNSKLGKQTR